MKQTSAKWKYAFFITLLLLISSNFYWIYVTIDNAVGSTYRNQVLDEKSTALEQLLEIAPKISEGMSKAELLNVLKTSSEESEPFAKEGQIHHLYLSFSFDANGGLKGITTNP